MAAAVGARGVGIWDPELPLMVVEVVEAVVVGISGAGMRGGGIPPLTGSRGD